MRAPKSGILAGGVALAVVLVGAIPAAAATTTRWASWQDLTGSGGAYSASVEIAASPAITATMTSDSRAGQVGVISGSSVWLSEDTPVGAKYGSSVNHQYLNLRPRADNAASPSTTTYSFANPTPTSGWTFVLGDIDADSVRIQAIGPGGQALTAAQFGFRGGFNYCAPGLTGKPSCTGDAADVPTWDPATLTLTGNDAAADTSGASAWFEPSAPISSLSLVFTRRAGFPVYQTWFASIARDITGTVTDVVDGPLGGVPVSLTDANGVVATTTTTNGGAYSFAGFVATDGYTVRISAPAGKIAVSGNAQQVDLTDADAVADFTVRDIVPVAVSGRVTDDDGNALAGVTVSIDGGQSTTTDADGFYLFDSVAVGGHTVVVSALTGYSITDPTQIINVPADSEVPIEDVDFAFVENPTLSGSVLATGAGVPGVTVTATAPGGTTLTAVTDANGDYSFPRLPSGAYDVTVTTPAGYTATGATTRTENVAADDVLDVDFALARLGAIDGVVRGDGGAPIAGAVVTVAGGGTSQQLTTDAAGAYGLGDLAPGTYTITVTPPAGTTVVGSATRTVTITGAGEAFVDQDFTLAALVVPPTDPVQPADPGSGGAATPGGGKGGVTRLPGTGLGPETFAWAGAGAAVLAVGAVLLVVSRRRSRRDSSDIDG